MAATRIYVRFWQHLLNSESLLRPANQLKLLHPVGVWKVPSQYISTSQSSEAKRKAEITSTKLQKFLNKKQHKDFSAIESSAQLESKPRTNLSNKPMKPDNKGKLHTYNVILQENIVNLISSGFISEELQDLNVQILGVRLTGDRATCKVYWQSSGNYASDEKIQKVLDRFAPRVRHALISYHVLGKIPKVLFMRDKSAENAAEVEKLLEIADCGPDFDPAEIEHEELGNLFDIPNQKNEPILGLDRDEINQKIQDLKSNLTDFEDLFKNAKDIRKDLKSFKTDLRKRKELRRKSLKGLGDINETDMIVNEEIEWEEESYEEEFEYSVGEDEEFRQNEFDEDELDKDT